MRAVGFFPDGVGVRNFLLGPFLKKASQRGEFFVFHSIPDNLLATYQAGFHGEATWKRCIPYRDNLSAAFLRKSLSHAHLCYGDTQAMRYARMLPVKGRLKTRAMTYAAKTLGRLSGSQSRIQRLDRWHQAAAEQLPVVGEYRSLFEEIKPSIVFSSHQRPLEVLPPVLAARSLNIPTATFIFSWDNITSKARIAAPFDHFLVWSNHMRDELLQYYPEIPADHVHVVGTPQFDPYADDRLLWSREEFCRRVKADPARPLICYSGGEPGTTPEDQHHVRVLMQLVREGRVRGNPQVLVRPAPVTRMDETVRYAEVCRDFPELTYCRPDWLFTKPGDFVTVLPSQDDVQFLANLTYHADLNVNLASTMTLDFAIRDTPVVNVAFNVLDPPPFGIPLRDYYYKFEHYQPVLQAKATRVAYSPDELAEHVNAYLDDPSLDRENRRRLVDLELDLPLGRASDKILKTLEQLAT